MTNLKAAAISGSLRKDSLNRKALQIAKKIALDLGIEVIEIDLKTYNLPIYDGDIEDSGIPQKVRELKEIIENVDILIIASPEYNHSISGALKNSIDWVTRGNNSFTKKVAAIFGVSSGSFGTVRGQNHLRQILTSLNVYVIPQPQVFITNGDTAFYEDGTLKNIISQELLENLIKKAYEVALKLKTNLS